MEMFLICLFSDFLFYFPYPDDVPLFSFDWYPNSPSINNFYIFIILYW